ncbi:hypothetical protein ALO87_03097 [Pseudomonas syringae pv. apii]|uniref:hypothetical protein n=1 Tax=Pseudomonas syringae group genomosp. 3 TaxID=251701 RepID=UPI0006E5508F|nr:hypothetical protein [Pseudomonas syringae group genomosp. 3]KPW33963.1 hypothetical protein ALO87_03097 [Pseudomonas syringae pv. apii]
MSNDKMREEFEAWWLSGTYPFRVMDRLEDAGVSEESAQEIWQASREALVIELPKDIKSMAGPLMYADDVRESVAAAGISWAVKP